MTRRGLDIEDRLRAPPRDDWDPHELITHIERGRSLMRATREHVNKAVLADLIRFLEFRLKQAVGGEAEPPVPQRATAFRSAHRHGGTAL